MADTAGLLPLLTPDTPGLDINATDAPKIIAVSVVLIILSTAAVVLRFISRMLSKAGLWWDDWLIVAALVKPNGISKSKNWTDRSQVMTWCACLLMITSTFNRSPPLVSA